MNNPIPRIATIQTLAGFGRCSLTVAIPILSAMGIQVCPVPTMVLSTHTGGLGRPIIQETSAIFGEWLEHWKSLELTFDALTSGYLGSKSQIQQVIAFFEAFKTIDNFVLVDPVMGDRGQHYALFDQEMQDEMRRLVCVADIVTPNLTELYLLIDKPYTEDVLDKAQIKSYLEDLARLGPRYIVAKGIPTDQGKANVCYDHQTEEIWIQVYDEVPAHFHGTGDAFASLLVGEIIKGQTLPEATKEAAVFIRELVADTASANVDPRFGILLENHLSRLYTKE